MTKNVLETFSLKGKTALVVGGSGVLGGAIAAGLAQAGAQIALTSRDVSRAQEVARQLRAYGITARGYGADVRDESSLRAVADQIAQDFSQLDILVNAVGGNFPSATTNHARRFFDLAAKDIQDVMDLNLMGGVILPCLCFAPYLLRNVNGGSIINIASMAALRPLTRIVAYSAAKAAVVNFTQWLAVHVAQEYSPQIRVNAVAPGFFITEQNRFLLIDEVSGEPTERSQRILDHTPMKRLGTPEDLLGAVVWLAGDASRFVTGIVVPVDGGFSAYSGV